MRVLKIEDREYVIKYSINSLIEMESYLGKPFTSVFSEDGISLLALRTLAYFGMKQMDHDLTHEKAGIIISQALESGMTFSEVVEAFVNEMNRALGFKKEISEKN